MPKISIIIPMFNSSATVRAALDSLLAQTERAWEAIIVDDGSTDGCGAIVEEYAQRDARFRLVRRANGGPAAARNTGLELATGAYIAFFDPDDLMNADAYETLLRLAATSPHRAALAGWTHCDAAGRPLAWNESAARYPRFGLDQLLGLECFAIHAQLLHRDTLDGLRFEETLPLNEDTDLFLRLAIRGVEWTTTDRTVCTYRLKATDRGTPKFACRFMYNIRVVRDGYTRARAAGWAARGMDVSDTRETRLLHSHALRYANLTIVQDPSPRKELAAEVFAMVRSDQPITAGLAALAVRDFQYVDCISPARLERELERYVPALAAWWDRCVGEGWAGPGFISEARWALSREVASMQDLAAAMLDRAERFGAGRGGAGRPIVVLGLGRNGIRLAQELHRRGRPVVARDDGIDAQTAAARIAPSPLTFVNRDAAYDAEPIYLLSVLNDEAYRARLPAGLEVIRWADLFRDRTDAIHERLLRAWPETEPLGTPATSDSSLSPTSTVTPESPASPRRAA